MCYRKAEITKEITNNALTSIPMKEIMGINELIFISDRQVLTFTLKVDLT